MAPRGCRPRGGHSTPPGTRPNAGGCASALLLTGGGREPIGLRPAGRHAGNRSNRQCAGTPSRRAKDTATASPRRQSFPIGGSRVRPTWGRPTHRRPLVAEDATARVGGLVLPWPDVRNGVPLSCKTEVGARIGGWGGESRQPRHSSGPVQAAPDAAWPGSAREASDAGRAARHGAAVAPGEALLAAPPRRTRDPPMGERGRRRDS